MKTRIVKIQYNLYTNYEPQYKWLNLFWLPIDPNNTYKDFKPANELALQCSTKPLITILTN